MRSSRVLLIGFAAMASIVAQSSFAQQKTTQPWNVTFAEDFSGRELNLGRWIPHDPFNPQKGSTVTFSNGAIELRGVIATLGLFSQLYGRFEVRGRLLQPRSRVRVRLLPVHLATLPAIDLFEAGANGPSRIFFANHWGTEQTERSYGDWFDAPDLSAAPHTVSVEWSRERIVWAVDGKEKFESVEGVPRESMFLEINGDAVTGPAVEISSVRVYQRP